MTSTAVQAAPAPRMPVRRLGRVLRIIHPFPTLLNVAATAGLAAVAADGVPDASLLARMMLMMFFVQSAIGVTNDLVDRGLDAAAKPWKPLVSGAISRSGAVALALACIAASVALAATLGAAAFVLALAGLACGLAYDAGLKRTLFSAVPFTVAIPTLPLWVWVSLDRWDAVLWWIVPLGALIGLSLHLANTLPDISSDAAYDVRGLAHRIGERGSMMLAWSSFAAALALAVALAPLISYDARVFVPTLALGTASLAASVVIGGLGRSTASLQLAFGVMGIGAAAAAVGWLAAAT